MPGLPHYKSWHCSGATIDLPYRRSASYSTRMLVFINFFSPRCGYFRAQWKFYTESLLVAELILYQMIFPWGEGSSHPASQIYHHTCSVLSNRSFVYELISYLWWISFLPEVPTFESPRLSDTIRCPENGSVFDSSCCLLKCWKPCKYNNLIPSWSLPS